MEPGETPCAEGFKKISAKERKNETGFMLEQGKTYYYLAEGTWSDAKHTCDANGYEDPELDKFNHFKQVEEANWFQLIGKVDDEIFILGKQGSFGATATGELICFANDAPLMRWNNHGSVCLKISETEI